MLDEFRRLALFTSGVAELTRHRAEQLVRDMVKSGDVRRDQASSLVKTLLDVGRQNREQITELIRAEIRRQMSNVGVVEKRDLERLERRVARLEERMKGTKTTSSRPKKTTARKKTATPASRTTGPGGSPETRTKSIDPATTTAVTPEPNE